MANTIPTMQDLLSAGVHFGHKASRAHPKMEEFIYGAREGVDIIDLAKSEEKLQAATDAAYDLGKTGKTLLIVGTKKQAREIIEQLAKEVDTPYLSVRWVGGLLTNFDEIKKNFKRLNGLKEEQAKGELKRYTKKEQLLYSRKLAKYEAELGGVANIEKIPDAMFIVDAVADNTAIVEAQKMNLIILGLCDTNANPNWFSYPVPSNDDGIKAIKIMCETLIRSYGEGKKEAAKNVETAAKKAAEDEAAKVEATLNEKVAEETAVLEEVVEKKVLEESERKV